MFCSIQEAWPDLYNSKNVSEHFQPINYEHAETRPKLVNKKHNYIFINALHL